MVFLAGFVLESLYDAEFPRVMDVLHDDPVDSLLVFAVDAGGFGEFGFDAGDGGRVGVGVKVANEGVDHFDG